jgi:hypothetical protein
MSISRAIRREEARQAQNTCPTIQVKWRAARKLQMMVNRQWGPDDWDLSWIAEVPI